MIFAVVIGWDESGAAPAERPVNHGAAALCAGNEMRRTGRAGWTPTCGPLFVQPPEIVKRFTDGSV